MFNPETANVLPNNAQIIARQRIGDTWVWICEYLGPHPYVTWVSDSHCPGETVWGHYFGDFIAAYRDFLKRTSDMVEYVECQK